MLLLALLAMTTSIDFAALDEAIERCDRAAVLPVFAQEMRRRSRFVSQTYAEQARISAERAELASARQLTPPLGADVIASRQLALDDRQRALDDARRLELLRREAIELKRQYFLDHCSAARRKTD